MAFGCRGWEGQRLVDLERWEVTREARTGEDVVFELARVQVIGKPDVSAVHGEVVEKLGEDSLYEARRRGGRNAPNGGAPGRKAKGGGELSLSEDGHECKESGGEQCRRTLLVLYSTLQSRPPDSRFGVLCNFDRKWPSTMLTTGSPIVLPQLVMASTSALPRNRLRPPFAIGRWPPKHNSSIQSPKPIQSLQQSDLTLLFDHVRVHTLSLVF